MAEPEKLKPATAGSGQPKGGPTTEDGPSEDTAPKTARKLFWEKPRSPTEAENATQKAEKREKWHAEKEKEAALKEKEAELQWEREAEARAIKAGRPPGAPKLPEGKGRPKRFVATRLNTGRPFLERNIPVKEKPKGKPPAPVPEAEPTVAPEPEPTPPTDDDKKQLPPLDVAATTRAVVAERLPVSPPDRPPRPMCLADDIDGGGVNSVNGVTLNHVLRVVNDALRVEMSRDPDVYAALNHEIHGPLRVLDDLGKLVRLLFLSMDKHREQLWREKKAAIRAAKEAAEKAAEKAAEQAAKQPSEAGEVDEKPEPVKRTARRRTWLGAVSVFSTPIREFAPPPRDQKKRDPEEKKETKDEDDGDDEGGEDAEDEGEDDDQEKDGEGEDGENGENEEENDEDGEKNKSENEKEKEKEKEKKEKEKEKKEKEKADEEALYSFMGPGFLRNDSFDSDNEGEDENDDPDNDEHNLIRHAVQRGDTRNANIMRALAAIKRSHGTVFHAPDDSDDSMSSSDSEIELHSKFSWDYLKIPSPSLGSKFPRIEPPSDPLDPRRHEMFTIDERRFEEAVENKKARLAAREARRKAREEILAKIEATAAEREAELRRVREQAHKAATEAVQNQLADLEDERDAALQLAKLAVYERDEIETGKEVREREMDQLRTLVRELVDREFPQSDEEAGEEDSVEKTKDKEKAEEDVEETQEDVGESKQDESNENINEAKEDAEDDKQEVEKTKEGDDNTKDEQPEDPTETDPLPELPTAADFMGMASRRSSRQFNRISVPPDIPFPPLTPFAPTTPNIPTVPPTPSTPMEKWDRQRLIDEVERILRSTAPPPTPLGQQFNQRPPPPSPAPQRHKSGSKRGSTYFIRKIRAPLGDGFFASIFDVLLTILLMVARQKSNVITVSSYIWYKYLVPTYRPLQNVALRLSRRLLPRRQSQPTSRSANMANKPEGEAVLPGQPLVTTPAPFATMASLHNQSSRTSLAINHRHNFRRAYFVFPRDAIAEIFVFCFVTFAGFCLVSTIRERNLWLDANNTAAEPAIDFSWALFHTRIMAPSYRISTQTRRGARNAYPEHDDFEGLPVRQWRHEWINVEPPVTTHTNESKANNRWAHELPHGMPKDWQLLPPHTQDLLRAARSGILYKRRAPVEEEEPEADGAAAAPGAAGATGAGARSGSAGANGAAGANGHAAAGAASGNNATAGDKKKAGAAANAQANKDKEGGYTVKVWKQMARDVDSPMPTHLAKRRKNTIVLPPKQLTDSNGMPAGSSLAMPMVTVAKVRRLDAAGNAYEQSVTLADGQQQVVDGEILSTTLLPATTRDLPPTLQQQQQQGQLQGTPNRKRAPPPRRKAKVGRGRKKGVLPPGLHRGRAAAAAAAAAAEAAAAAGGVPVDPNAPPAEGVEGTPVPAGEGAAIATTEGTPSLDQQLPLPQVGDDHLRTTAFSAEPERAASASEGVVAKEESESSLAPAPKEEPKDEEMSDVSPVAQPLAEQEPKQDVVNEQPQPAASAEPESKPEQQVEEERPDEPMLDRPGEEQQPAAAEPEPETAQEKPVEEPKEEVMAGEPAAEAPSAPPSAPEPTKEATPAAPASPTPPAPAPAVEEPVKSEPTPEQQEQQPAPESMAVDSAPDPVSEPTPAVAAEPERQPTPKEATPAPAVLSPAEPEPKEASAPPAPAPAPPADEPAAAAKEPTPEAPAAVREPSPEKKSPEAEVAPASASEPTPPPAAAPASEEPAPAVEAPAAEPEPTTAPAEPTPPPPPAESEAAPKEPSPVAEPTTAPAAESEPAPATEEAAAAPSASTEEKPTEEPAVQASPTADAAPVEAGEKTEAEKTAEQD
ncbi:hypothetical protein Sste5346_006860 [Sporothrix stenoceras]|uniref:Uncharacterized protein n=1 Tax=Sporothrix stenoceras TaxID=5173 RepID=A0ABR3YXY2_9PEZI